MDLLNKDSVFTGTKINYFFICPTKLWLFSHFTTMEQNSELVALGNLVQNDTYKKDKKDIVIDQNIAIDFIKRGKGLVLHEIKKSSKMEKAHEMQLLYYLYYLKTEKGIDNAVGEIDYPKQRHILRINLTEKKETELKSAFGKISQIISLPKPPKPEKKRICRKCSYFEFCFSN
jgi:CRISPR-associated exonuclease Cas4